MISLTWGPKINPQDNGYTTKEYEHHQAGPHGPQERIVVTQVGRHVQNQPDRGTTLHWHGRRATIIASQVPVSGWYETLESNATAADAILDRIIHSATKFELHGESLRKKVLFCAIKTVTVCFVLL